MKWKYDNYLLTMWGTAVVGEVNLPVGGKYAQLRTATCMLEL